jgi:hypothetical protein
VSGTAKTEHKAMHVSFVRSIAKLNNEKVDKYDPLRNKILTFLFKYTFNPPIFSI